MVNNLVHIVMPVKDSIETAERAIRAILDSGHTLTVYDDYSTPENAGRLDGLAQEWGFKVVHVRDHFHHQSPNYRWVLIESQYTALEKKVPLVIVESDVIVREHTIDRLLEAVTSDEIGMVAAITVDENGAINFPYEYARRRKEDGVCKKRMSFCCTLLSYAFLQAYDFVQLLPQKDWYDVSISHTAKRMGFKSILQVTNPVLHMPHSSRPWKQLKKTRPILYYIRKILQHRDRI